MATEEENVDGPSVPRACFMAHKAESLNCQVGRRMTAGITGAIFNPPDPGIVRFMQLREDFGNETTVCSVAWPLSVESFMQDKAESHRLGFIIIRGHL